ncbi:hypothetical protein IWW38_002067 [Coemansia aciculifera]|uniref:Uncharacterized protein n=1 Tax=Coemansia aciculifera TaxID=417176 RepID=A0ACC1M5C0_9FUNG|nr:hypothetical protein IWW38_002067 [Coemansia aciculifera]
MANIRAFVQQLKQLVPNILDIHVLACGGCNPQDEKNPNLHFGYLLSHLFGLCSRVKLSSGVLKLFRNDLQLDIICNLTHIDFQMNYDRKLALEMISQNAPTLISVSLRFPSDADPSGLFWSPDGCNIEYPNLHSLRLTTWESNRNDSIQREYPDAVPFPSLRRLKMECRYMFIDDVVFRGNAATLEYLQLQLTDATLATIQSRNVFTPVSHPKLRHVDVDLTSHGFRRAAFVHYSEFLTNIGPSAPVRAFHRLSKDDVAFLITRSPPSSSLSNIQFLDLPNNVLSVWDIVGIIRSLPQLTDLRTKSVNLRPLPDDLPLDELPALMISKYGSGSEQFLRWRFTCEFGSFGDHVMCVFLLALVCPNFYYAGESRFGDEEATKEVENVIASKGFIDHEARLKGVRFGFVYLK